MGGESIGELLDRVIPAIDRLIADDSWESALLVLHGGVNRAILSYALTGRRAFLGGLEQAPACVNIIDVGSADWVVRTVGWTAYDPTHTGFTATTMEQLYEHYLRHRAETPPGPREQSALP
jgi:probable phosphoglycerate mutase